MKTQEAYSRLQWEAENSSGSINMSVSLDWKWSLRNWKRLPIFFFWYKKINKDLSNFFTFTCLNWRMQTGILKFLYLVEEEEENLLPARCCILSHCCVFMMVCWCGHLLFSIPYTRNPLPPSTSKCVTCLRFNNHFNDKSFSARVYLAVSEGVFKNVCTS